MPPRTFDRWADSLCEEIAGVNREIWDVFARQRFINFLIAEEVLIMQREPNGAILLIETEEKSSAAEPETEEKSSDENSGETASEAV